MTSATRKKISEVYHAYENVFDKKIRQLESDVLQISESPLINEVPRVIRRAAIEAKVLHHLSSHDKPVDFMTIVKEAEVCIEYAKDDIASVDEYKKAKHA